MNLVNCENNHRKNKRQYVQSSEVMKRNLDPDVINVSWGYKIDVFAQGLDTPIGISFTESGDMLIGDAGLATGNAKVILLRNGVIRTIAEGFNVPLTGINYHNGYIYVSHKGVISVIQEDGTRNDIISGLPSFGDFSNNRVEFNTDNKMYFGQGTASNSGVVGVDNKWVFNHPYFHDYAGSPVILKGVNYQTKNVLIPATKVAYTGAFSGFGIPNHYPFEVEEKRTMASGSILKANLDGSNLEMVAWGLRNPFQVKFDIYQRLIITNQGMDNRGSRPIPNGMDELQLLKPGAWYGWPDYVAGEPVTASRFRALSGEQPRLLLESIPSVPPYPITTFPVGSNIMGFDFNYKENFGPVGDAYIAQFGKVQYEEVADYIRSGVGHRISRVNMTTGEVSTFAINKSGFPQDEGLARPTDVKFGQDGAMYISDFSIDSMEFPNVIFPKTGVIWKITKE